MIETTDMIVKKLIGIIAKHIMFSCVQKNHDKTKNPGENVEKTNLRNYFHRDSVKLYLLLKSRTEKKPYKIIGHE